MLRIDRIPKEPLLVLDRKGSGPLQDGLKKACGEFESYFLGFMFKRSIQPVLVTESPFLSKHERWFKDMFVDEVARSASRANGIGLAEYLYRNLAGSLVQESESGD
ncbi:MAG TPA: rod-binding protein [Atribacteraceae bacterium]|nr:rod-binding protein [Atribacteraceae bacterium]